MRALPPLVMIYGPRVAVPIMAIAAVMANVGRVAAWWRRIDWRAVAVYAIPGTPAAVLGAQTLLTISQTLVEGFLGAFFVASPDALKALWWTHTLALLVFLPLIPHTQHLHLALSPATVFLKRDGFSAIPPLTGDEDFGLDTGKDVTRIDALQAFSCVECGRCTEHCPAYNTGKILNPKEIVLGLRNYLNQFGPNAEAPLLGQFISEEAAFQCTTCGSCEFQCPVGIQHLPMIVGLRRGAVNTGKWENEYGAKLFLNMERNGNALGFSGAERQKFIEKNQRPLYDGTQEYSDDLLRRRFGCGRGAAQLLRGTTEECGRDRPGRGNPGGVWRGGRPDAVL